MLTVEHSFLLAIRFILALQNSYIHPDEHFQSFQIANHMLIDSNSQIPWEFKTGSRSLIPIYLIYYPILKLSKLYTTLSNLQILYLARLLFCMSSWLIIDSFILKSNKRKVLVKNSSYSALLLIYSSYIISAYQSHTFSNSIETLLLILSVSIIYDLKHSTSPTDKIPPNVNTTVSSMKLVALALILVLGTFNRITFPAFLLLPSYYIFKYFIGFQFRSTRYYLSFKLNHAVQFLLFTALIITFTYAFIIIDTNLYLKYLPDSISDKDKLVITFWNNFKYNSNIENLKNHGIHKRYTHLIINLPQMLGPLYLIFLIKLRNFIYFLVIQCQKALNNFSSSSMSKSKANSSSELFFKKFNFFISNFCQLNSHQYLDIWNKDICYLLIISSLIVLSLFPHQELRFLIPLQPLILNIIDFWFLNEEALSVQKNNQKDSTTASDKNGKNGPTSLIYAVTPNVKKLVHNILLAWYIFNLAMGILMGVFHQAGVISVLDYFNAKSSISSENEGKMYHIQIWWRNYSPPTWMLASSFDYVDNGVNRFSNHSTIVNYNIIPYENDITSSLLEITESMVPKFETKYENFRKNIMVLDVMGMKPLQLLDLFHIVFEDKEILDKFNEKVLSLDLICPCSSFENLLIPSMSSAKKPIRSEKIFMDLFHLNMDHLELGICVYSIKP